MIVQHKFGLLRSMLTPRYTFMWTIVRQCLVRHVDVIATACLYWFLSPTLKLLIDSVFFLQFSSSIVCSFGWNTWSTELNGPIIGMRENSFVGKYKLFVLSIVRSEHDLSQLVNLNKISHYLLHVNLWTQMLLFTFQYSWAAQIRHFNHCTHLNFLSNMFLLILRKSRKIIANAYKLLYSQQGGNGAYCFSDTVQNIDQTKRKNESSSTDMCLYVCGLVAV